MSTDWIRQFRFRLLALFRKRKLEAEMAEEMRVHLENETRRHVAAGLSLEEAHAAARRSFGGVDQMQERCRDERKFGWVEDFLRDARFAIRMLRKNPGFAAVAVLSLALGIGANTAVFSVVQGVLLSPLAYREPQRLVTLLHLGRFPVAPADFLDWRAQSHSFEAIAAAELWGAALVGTDRAEAVPGIRFSETMFDVLGVNALLGRTLQASDFAPGAERALVLGHGLWQRRFGGDRGIIGRRVSLSGETFTVVGVMPPGFRFAPFWATQAEMAAPLDLTTRSASRDGNSLRVFARLRPGVSRDQAQAEMDAICRQLEQAYPQTNSGRTVQVDTLLDKTVAPVRGSLRLLAGAVALVLLMACANVANLLLVRSSVRRQEMAVRTALGASPGRTFRQLLAESTVLAGAGGTLGLLLGYAAVGAIRGWLANEAIPSRLRMPRIGEIAVDSTTVLFTLGLAVLTAIAFGLAPALQTARFAQRDPLQESGRQVSGGRRTQRLRGALVIAELALAVVTLIGAGLLLRSFGRLAAIDPGFESRQALSMVVSLHGQPDMAGEKREAFYRELLGRIEALPGVVRASAINHLPLAGDLWASGLAFEGRPPAPPGERLAVVHRVCRPGYFETMDIALEHGRDFDGRDTPASSGVVIINQQLARQHWPGENPLGRRLALDDLSENQQWLTVVGVVENVRQESWTKEPREEVYLPFAQSPFFSQTAGQYSAMTIVIRTAADPLTVIGPVQEAVRSLNDRAPIASIATLEQVVAGSLWQPRFNLYLIAIFAGVALLLAATGLYGVIAYAVTLRTREIGVRVALGARRRDVLILTLGQGLKLAGVGLLLGLAGALGLTRLLTSLLYGVTATDPATFAVVPVLLLAVALLACWRPARRAAKVDPMTALRAE